jgi:hypothetical protein
MFDFHGPAFFAAFAVTFMILYATACPKKVIIKLPVSNKQYQDATGCFEYHEAKVPCDDDAVPHPQH